MVQPVVSDKEFIALWHEHRSARQVAEITGVNIRNTHMRRRNIEKKYNIELRADGPRNDVYPHAGGVYPGRMELGIRNGTVLVFSDAHFWPGLRTAAFRGLLWALKELKPVAVIANGDIFDGATISRHPRIMWSRAPSVIEELKACQAAMGEIEAAAGRAKLIWTLGNHDARYETRLANSTPEFSEISGFKLSDQFTRWKMCWAAWPTEHVVIKHRFKGGLHATHNNTLTAGKTMVTGHLHSLKVTPFSDYSGTRFGVDTGTLADPYGPQFQDYTEDNPVNWRSGFAVLTFHDGQLLWPELVHRIREDAVEFRGKVIQV